MVAGTGTAKEAGPTITVSAPGAPITAVELFTSTGVAVGAGAGDFLVVWHEGENGGPSSRLMARRIRSDLLPDEAQPFELVHGLSLWGRPDVAFDGSQWLVAYSETTDQLEAVVRGLRVSRQGTLVDAAPLQISYPASRENDTAPQVVWVGGKFVVAWASSLWYGAHTPVMTSIAVARVAGDGSVSPSQLVSPVVASRYSGTVGLSQTIQSPRLTAGAHSLLLTWWEESDRNDGSGFVEMNIAGSLLDAQPAPVAQSSGRRRAAAHPTARTFASQADYTYAVAFDGTRYHLLHQENGSPLLRDTSIDENGASGAAVTIATVPTAVIDDAIAVPGGVEVLLHTHTSGAPFGPTQRLFWLSIPWECGRLARLRWASRARRSPPRPPGRPHRAREPA